MTEHNPTKTAGRWGRASHRVTYLDVSEVRVGDEAYFSGYWWRIIEFFPGIGDQVRGERKGREDTAFVRNVQRWRRVKDPAQS